jgi:DNA-binding phage protein
MRVLETKDIVSLLRFETKRAGSVSAWAQRTGIPRTTVSKVLSNVRPPTQAIIKALNLRTVVVAKNKKAAK